jgi:hypothetical protein
MTGGRGTHLAGSELSGNLHADTRGLDDGVDHHARSQLQFVDGLARDQRYESMRSRLYLHLSDHSVLHDPGDDSDEAIARRLRAGLVRGRSAGDLDRELGEFQPFEVSPSIGADLGFDSTRNDPSPDGVGADAQQLGGLTNLVERHRRIVGENPGVHNCSELVIKNRQLTQT